MIDKNTDNIQVMIRCRALNERERKEGAKSCIIIDKDSPNTLILDEKPTQKIYNFDYVGNEDAS